MHASIITSLLAVASLATAAPAMRSRGTYHGVSLEVQTSSGLDPNHVVEPAPIEINVLTACNGGNGQGCSVSKISIDPGIAINVDINSVECRAYKDFEGQEPGSAPFSIKSPAEISTNLATVSSILCYIVEQ
jgi:hypothetical protein